ncbi:MAG: hypothetical protein ACYC42_05370 [Lysobacter sp.]
MTTRSEVGSRDADHEDAGPFSAWEPGQSFNDRLRFEGCQITEGNLTMRFFSPALEKTLTVQSDTHLLVRYANESANFLAFDQLQIADKRMFVSKKSKWLRDFFDSSSGVFDGLLPMHYLFIFSNASVEMICLGEPRIVAEAM